MLPCYKHHPKLDIDYLYDTLWNYRSPTQGYGNKNIIGSFGTRAITEILDKFPTDPIILTGLGGSGTIYAAGTYLCADKENLFHLVLDAKASNRHYHFPKESKVVMVDDDICRGRTAQRIIRRLKRLGRTLDLIVVVKNNHHSKVFLDGSREIPIVELVRRKY